MKLPLLTRKEACEYLRISLRKLETLITVKTIGCVRIGKSVRLEQAELDRFISGSRIEPHIATDRGIDSILEKLGSRLYGV